MDISYFSPRKQQMLNQLSPRLSSHKRSLFPTTSPQNDDLGLINELSASDTSETYSPLPISPSSSVTPIKNDTRAFGKELQLSNYSNIFTPSPNSTDQQCAARKSYITILSKENMIVRNSATKSNTKAFMARDSFEDYFETVLSDNSEDEHILNEIKYKPDTFTTPKKTTVAANKKSVASPRSPKITIKPNSFYGNIAPILATNQTNRIQGMKCVFRPVHVQPSRAKAKLLFEDKPARKRNRSNSKDVTRSAKRRKTMFSGVVHAVTKPNQSRPNDEKSNKKQDTIRGKALLKTDLSRTPYSVKQNNKKVDIWEYTLRFTKPIRYDKDIGSKRKFFKSSLKESPSLIKSPDLQSPNVTKKRKLLDTRVNYLKENSLMKVQFNPADISAMIDDLDNEQHVLHNSIEVDNLVLRLEEDDAGQKEKDREAEREMLMNILEDSTDKMSAIDSLSSYTASLDLNDSLNESSKSSLGITSESKDTSPRRYFSLFNSPAINRSQPVLNNHGSSSTKKWRGLGTNQLQIDAGQKKFGAHQCHECGMIYQLGEAEDEMQHNSFHNELSTLNHSQWKNEKIVGCYGMEYTIVVTENDPKSWQHKTLNVVALIDKALGITSDTPFVLRNNKIFLYIAERRIVGCMVACPVKWAYKMEGSESDVNLCSQESYPVRCGISRMWTLYSYRRKGVATRLLDTVRRNFYFGSILSEKQVAFSIPTPDGKQFATKYMGSPNFLVYTGC